MLYLSVLGGMWGMRVVAVNLVVFGENGFIVKISRDVLWSEVLLLSTFLVGFLNRKMAA